MKQYIAPPPGIPEPVDAPENAPPGDIPNLPQEAPPNI